MRIPSLPLVACALLAGSHLSAQTPSLEGTWVGSLAVPGAELRMIFHVRAGEDETFVATMDIPAQAAVGIPVSEVTVKADSVRLWVAPIQAGFEGVWSGTDSLTGHWKQSGQSFPLVLGRAADGESGAPRRPQDPTPPFPYEVEEVAYPNPAAPGVRIAGTLTRPRGEGPHPAVLLVSGSGPQNRDEELLGHRPFLVLADHLTRRGIAVLRVDDRGVGESTGDFGAADSRDFASDARAGVEYLAGRADIDRRAVGIVGHSEGGLVGPLVAAASDAVGFLVLLAGPGVPGDDILLAQGAAIQRASGLPEAQVQQAADLQRRLLAMVRADAAPDSAARAEMTALVKEMAAVQQQGASGIPDEMVQAQIDQITGPWFRFFLAHDPAPVLRGLDVPVLALVGSLDLQVPAELNAPALRAALEASRSPTFDVRTLEGLNHLFQTATTGSPAEYAGIEETMAPAVLEMVGDWILEVTARR